MRRRRVDSGLAAWKNTQNLEKWEFSDEEFVTRTRIVPKIKKRGRKRSCARQVEEVEEELHDIQKPLPKPLQTRLPTRDDWAQKNSETSIKPSGGTLTNNGENVDSRPDWSDWSEDREEIPQEKKPVDEETMQQIIEKLNAITARASQAAMEGGGVGHSSMSIDVGGSSHAEGFPVASQGSSKVPPAQPRKQTVPWAGVLGMPKSPQKLQKSRLPPGRNLSQAHHHPRKRAKKTGDIQRGDNLIKTTDQRRRVASIRRPSMAMTNPSEMSMDVDYDPIVSNTDEEDNLNDLIRSNGLQETIEMATPTRQPPGAANLRNGGQRRANHASHRAGGTEETEGDLDAIIVAGGWSAQRAFFRNRNDMIPADGGWARELKEDNLRVSNKRRRQVQWGRIGRLKHIKAVNRVRKQRSKATTESHRNAIRHIELMVLHVRFEGHLVTTLCNVISLPDGPGVDKIPPKVKVLVNSKGTVLGADNVAGTKLRVYEPWQVVELGEDLGVAVVSNFAEFFEVE